MNRIERLIQELCPNGVEYKELGEVLDYEQPTRYIVKSKEYNDNYSIPVLTAGQSFVLGYTNELDNVYVASKENPVIIFDDFTTSFHWVEFDFKIKSSAMKMLRVKKDSSENFRYIYHVMKNIKYKPEEHGRQWIGKYSKFKIPVPPLEIQEEIVKVLDKFANYVTELTAELTAELTDRKHQYSYYRDKLLSFEDSQVKVEWKTLGEVATFRRGSFPQPYGNQDWYNGENAQPFVQVADISDVGYRLNEKTKYLISQKAIPKSVFAPAGTVLVTLQGTIGRVAISQYDAYIDRTIAIFDAFKVDINKRYFAYQLKKKFDIEKQYARGSTLKTITKEEFSKFKIPIPPLSIQSKIVEVLDNFDKVCNDLNIGLPKEIEQRQKQYEYYRDLLLTFDVNSANTHTGVNR